MNSSALQPAPRLLVSADDLTGANDAGAQFAKQGISAVVLIGPETRTIPAEVQIAVVNTESRHSPPEAAAESIKRAVELGRREGMQFFYKKTDSTLRGNVGAELEAILHATGAALLPFVPALPQLGRTTLGGIHFVHGQPLAESAYGHDPLNPVRSSSVTEILRAQTDLPVISLGSQEAPSPAFGGICVYDCGSEEDLRATAQLLRKKKLLRVCAGAVGFLEQLADQIPFPVRARKRIAPCSPVLIVNGSINERAFSQISDSRSQPLVRVRLLPEVLVATKGLESRIGQALAHQVTGCWGADVLLHSALNRGEIEAYMQAGRAEKLDDQAVHLRIATNTGRFVAAILRTGLFRSLVVFGGDTLAGIAKACGWKSLVPLTEVADGITVSHPDDSELIVISKAGGFGDDRVLERILRFVKEPGGIENGT